MSFILGSLWFLSDCKLDISLVSLNLERVKTDNVNVTLFMCCLFTGSSAAAQSWSTLRNCSNTVSSCVQLDNCLLYDPLVMPVQLTN